MKLHKLITDMDPNPSVDQIIEHHRRLDQEREWAEVIKREDRKHRTVEILAWLMLASGVALLIWSFFGGK